MSLEYIRNYYKVPAKRGGRIRFDYYVEQGKQGDGTIIGTSGPHLQVRFDDGHEAPLHPTWKVIYLEEKTKGV